MNLRINYGGINVLFQRKLRVAGTFDYPLVMMMLTAGCSPKSNFRIFYIHSFFKYCYHCHHYHQYCYYCF